MMQLESQQLKGSWVLVRMRSDKFKGKRPNWLLIKHRDDFARDGDGESVLASDRSVASGRPMAAIAAGTGRAPKPFMAKASETLAGCSLGLQARPCRGIACAPENRSAASSVKNAKVYFPAVMPIA